MGTFLKATGHPLIQGIFETAILTILVLSHEGDGKIKLSYS
jgi:hypothetical protein